MRKILSTLKEEPIRKSPAIVILEFDDEFKALSTFLKENSEKINDTFNLPTLIKSILSSIEYRKNAEFELQYTIHSYWKSAEMLGLLDEDIEDQLITLLSNLGESMLRTFLQINIYLNDICQYTYLDHSGHYVYLISETELLNRRNIPEVING